MTVAMHRTVASLGALPMVVRTEYHDDVVLLLVSRVIFLPDLANFVLLDDDNRREPEADAALPKGEERGGGDEEEVRVRARGDDVGEEDWRNFAISESSSDKRC